MIFNPPSWVFSPQEVVDARNGGGNVDRALRELRHIKIIIPYIFKMFIIEVNSSYLIETTHFK